MAVLIDSSGWLEYVFDGPLAPSYEPHLRDPDVLVPTVVLYEVYKVVRTRLGPAAVTMAMGQLSNRESIPLDESLALSAAEASVTYGLSMADAIIYASARDRDALLVTSDRHFAELPGVEFIARPTGD